MRNLIKIKNLSKEYKTKNKTHIVFDNLSLLIKENKITILLGKTGCGKTTLMNIIAEIDSQYTGKIIKPNLNISYVFQNYTLFPWRNVLDNISFCLEVQGIKKIERLKQAKILVNKVGLQGFEKNYPHELSGGMRQRVAIAQSLAKKPNLLLLDEPFGALDDETRKNIQKLLLNIIKNENLTVVMITHNMDEALLLGDYIYTYSQGEFKLKELE